MMKGCHVCSNTSSKYKCARCRAPYCCIKCYSVHKEVCEGNGKERLLLNSVESTPIAKESRSEAIIPIEHLQALDKDVEVQALLRSKRLAEHILMIDDAGDRPLALKRLRETHPEFNGFVASVLRIVNDSALNAVTKKSRQTQALKDELQALVQADLEAQDALEEGVDDEGDFEELEENEHDEGSDCNDVVADEVDEDRD